MIVKETFQLPDEVLNHEGGGGRQKVILKTFIWGSNQLLLFITQDERLVIYAQRGDALFTHVSIFHCLKDVIESVYIDEGDQQTILLTTVLNEIYMLRFESIFSASTASKYTFTKLTTMNESISSFCFTSSISAVCKSRTSLLFLVGTKGGNVYRLLCSLKGKEVQLTKVFCLQLPMPIVTVSLFNPSSSSLALLPASSSLSIILLTLHSPLRLYILHSDASFLANHKPYSVLCEYSASTFVEIADCNAHVDSLLLVHPENEELYRYSVCTDKGLFTGLLLASDLVNK